MQAQIAEGELHGHHYSVVSSSYADAIHILVHKDEKIARMFRCQLYPQPGGVTAADSIFVGLNPEALIGSSSDDTAGRLYTEVIGSMILKQNSDESRMLVLGLGNVGPRTDDDITKEYREELLFIVDLVRQTQSAWV